MLPPLSRRLVADPAHVAKARELRDRWLEQVNADGGTSLAQGKYDVSRQLAGSATPTPAVIIHPTPLLGAA